MWKFGLLHGHDEFAELANANAMLLCELEESASTSAKNSLPRSRSVIDARVNDSRIAPRLVPAQRGLLLDQDKARGG